MDNSFYTAKELKSMKFFSIGKNVKISKKASLYSIERISIGNNVRIDDFCILTGNVSIGNYVHIAAYSAIYGGAGVKIDDFANISSRVSIYSVSDDYSGNCMTNPMVPKELTGVIRKSVIIEKHVIIGTNSTVMPGVMIGAGSAFGSYSFITESTEPWGIYAGIPCKRIKDRNKEPINLEKKIKQL